MKTLFIIPPFASHNKYCDRKPLLSVLYLAASLVKEGYEVKIFDASVGPVSKKNGVFYYGVSKTTLIDTIKNEDPQIVGVSCFLSSRWAFASLVCDIVKSVNPKIVTAVGGIHASTWPVKCLRDNPNIDYAIIGEGEESFTTLVKQIEVNNNNYVEPMGIDGIAFRLNGQIVYIPKKTYIENLDTLPFPARHLVDWNQYFNAGSFRFDMSGKFFSLLSSRSCPLKCSFCNIHLSQGKTWRARTPDNVVDEIEYCISEYGVNNFSFEDDNLTFNKRRIQAICSKILDKNLKISFNTPNGVYVNSLDEKSLDLLKEAGCKSVLLAIESGSDYIRNDVYKKNLQYDQIERVVRYCDKIKLNAYSLLIVGAPQENNDTINETIKLIKKLPLKGINVSIFTPYKGTELYQEVVDKGYLTREKQDYIETGIFDLSDTPLFETPSFKFDDIKRWQKKLYMTFIMKNWLILIKNHFQQRQFGFTILLRLFYQFFVNPVKNTEDVNNLTAKGLIGE